MFQVLALFSHSQERILGRRAVLHWVLGGLGGSARAVRYIVVFAMLPVRLMLARGEIPPENRVRSLSFYAQVLECVDVVLCAAV